MTGSFESKSLLEKQVFKQRFLARNSHPLTTHLRNHESTIANRRAAEGDGYNQSPNELSNDLTTNQDLKGIANARVLGREESLSMQTSPPENHEGEFLHPT